MISRAYSRATQSPGELPAASFNQTRRWSSRLPMAVGLRRRPGRSGGRDRGSRLGGAERGRGAGGRAERPLAGGHQAEHEDDDAAGG